MNTHCTSNKYKKSFQHFVLFRDAGQLRMIIARLLVAAAFPAGNVNQFLSSKFAEA
jgi:hypothetical protein